MLNEIERQQLAIHLKTCLSCAQLQTHFSMLFVRIQPEQLPAPIEDRSLIELTASVLNEVEIRERRARRSKHRSRRTKLQLAFAVLPFALCLSLLGTDALAGARIVPTHVATPCTQHIAVLHGHATTLNRVVDR